MIEWLGPVIKFSAPVVVLGVSLWSILLESSCRNRPILDRLRAIGGRVAVMIATTLIAEVGIFSSHLSEQRQRRNSEAQAEARFQRARDQRREISTSIGELVTLARQRNPGLTEQQALTQISAEVRSLREETADLEDQITVLKRYSNVAELNARGVRGIAGPGLTESSPISRALEGAYAERGGRLYPLCDVNRLAQFGTVAQEHPDFPFTHYALAVCQQKLGNSSWREHANRALEILEHTTELAGHHPQQAQIQEELQRLLRGEEGNSER